MKHLKTFALLLLFAGSILAVIVPTILGAGPTTTWPSTSSHVTEGSNVNIILTLKGYSASQHYYFIVNVTDPSGSESGVNKTVQVDSNGNGVLTIRYPSDFILPVRAWTNLTGAYVANVTATNALKPSGTYTFTVGLTDQLSYQRSLKVRISAYGYKPGQEANITLAKGATRIFSHPRSTINSTGFVNDFWNIPVISGTDGSYTVTVSENSTVLKSPGDIQVFTVFPAVLTISNLYPSTASGKIETNVIRGNTTYAIFNVTYPNGTAVTNVGSSSNVLMLTPTGSPVSFTSSTSYSTTVKAFITASGHTFPVSAPVGSWSIRVIANQTDDGYGNLGPFTNMTTAFTVGVLSLKTSITALKTMYNRTVTFNVNATVSYPTSDSFNASSGIVFANLTGGTPITRQNLTYNPTTLLWTGSITIPPNYPLISATLQVSAHDKFGNTGTNTTFRIAVEPTTIIVHQIPFKVNGMNFQPFQTLGFQIDATYVNNQTLAQGGALGKITFNLPGGKSITVGLTLQSNGTLTGQYVIGDTVPLGRWNLTIGPWQLNDGYGNTNSKSVLGPVINIFPVQLRFDSSYFKAPGNNTITGDKVTVGVAFLYPNGSSTQSLIVNTTIFANGQYNNYTFTYDSGTVKYLTTIDTTGWAPGRYQVNITASFADYRGSHILWLTIQPTPFLLGPIVGALLILVILGIGAFEYTRRGKVPTET